MAADEASKDTATPIKYPEAYHPAFVPPDGSDILWRYMNCFKFEWLVDHKRLYMPCVSDLGDPFEGSTPRGEVDWWNDQIEQAGSDEKRQNLSRNRDFISRMARAWRMACFASCWHMNSTENSAMWGCYTSQDDSVAISTTYNTLRGCLLPFIGIGKIKYLDYEKDRLSRLNMLEFVMSKDQYYAFEQEVRALIFAGPAPPGEEPNSDLLDHMFETETVPIRRVFAPPIDPATLIDRIIFHPDASPEFQADIRKLCEERGLPEPELSRKNREPIF